MSSTENIDCSIYENTRSRKLKYEEQENKKKRSLHQREKDYARHNQDPSIRLGKNAKKEKS